MTACFTLLYFIHLLLFALSCRDLLHSELSSLRESVATVVPLAPVIHSALAGASMADAVVPPNLLVHQSTSSLTTASSLSSLHTEDLEDSPPFGQGLAQDLIDLSSPTDRSHKSATSVGISEADSGLASQQASIGAASSSATLQLHGQIRTGAPLPFRAPSSASLAGNAYDGSILRSLRPAGDRQVSGSWVPLSPISTAGEQEGGREGDGAFLRPQGREASSIAVVPGSEALSSSTSVPRLATSDTPSYSLPPISSQQSDLSVLSLNSTLADQSLHLSLPLTDNVAVLTTPHTHPPHLLGPQHEAAILSAPGAPDLTVIQLDSSLAVGNAQPSLGPSVFVPPTGTAATHNIQSVQG